MSDHDPDVLVLDGASISNGDSPPPPPGAAAVFQGMLSVLGEELEELHRGMAAVERNVADARAESRATPAMVAQQVEQALDRRLGVLATTLGTEQRRVDGAGLQEEVEQAVRRALGDLGVRLMEIEGSVAASSAAWSSSARVLTEAVASLVAKAVGDVGDRVGDLEQRVAALGQTFVDQSTVGVQEARLQWASIEARLAQLEATNGEGRAEASGAADRLERASAATREHLAGLEASVRAIQDAPPFAARTVVENLSPAIEDVNDRVARLEETLNRLVDQADLRATTLATELHGLLAAGMERVVTVASRSEETTALELHGTRGRIETIVTSLADLAAEVSGVAEVGRRLVDEGRSRPVLEAIDAASRENGEVLAALHTSITRRIDARVRSIGEMVDGLAAPLGATAALAPTLEGISQTVLAQHDAVERIRTISEELGGMVGAVPGGLAGSLGRQEAMLDEVRADVADRSVSSGALQAAVAGLDESIGRSLEAVRSYLGEGLMHVSRRQAGTGKAMESATAALQSMERQLNNLAGLCQSLASGVEQQSGASGRVADLVLETRAALRSDVDRLEATVHLEALKLHQQDQARLSGAASATSEVVEREAGLLAQRVSAVAAAVESVRTVLHAHVEDASRAGAVTAPLALVKDN